MSNIIVTLEEKQISATIEEKNISATIEEKNINVEVTGGRGPAGEDGAGGVGLEYVAYVSDSDLGNIVVTVLNSGASNYLGDITWSLNDPSSMTGTTTTDKFTIYTYMGRNYCQTNGVPDNKVTSAEVNGARSITLSYSLGLGTIAGLFKIEVYPGAYAESEI